MWDLNLTGSYDRCFGSKEKYGLSKSFSCFLDTMCHHSVSMEYSDTPLGAARNAIRDWFLFQHTEDDFMDKIYSIVTGTESYDINRGLSVYCVDVERGVFLRSNRPEKNDVVSKVASMVRASKLDAREEVIMCINSHFQALELLDSAPAIQLQSKRARL